ncbi:MAG: DUF2497 domain-containing protein [Brucellaceae bacterium]|nr:DUF2497 domain-containing protein [Brucellaceae bacterium]
MEEILSSIRRIIEDSDTTSNDNAGPSQARGKRLPKPVPGDEVVEEIDAFLEELSDNRPAEDGDQAGTGQRGPIGADEGRDARGEARNRGPVAAAKAAQPPRRVKPVESVAVRAPAEKSPAPTAAELASKLQVRTEEAKPVTAAPAARPAVAAMPAASAASAAKPSQPAAAPVPAKEPSLSAARLQPIVSAETGRQVQAAFGELNEAFQKSRAKSFDQVAEEMIRPMLQDWLDNNLPTLVERLVREEIERVARGE